jgi:hypothetical protein
LSVNGSSLILVNTRTPTGFSLAQHWHAERGAYPWDVRAAGAAIDCVDFT